MTTVAAPHPVAARSQGEPAVPRDPIFRLSVEQYHEMIRQGILTDNDPVELLEGWLVYKMSKNPPHRIATRLVTKALERIVPSGWYVDSQEPITTVDSEPEPDAAVIRGDTRDYIDRHPGSEQVGLVVEVADATLEQDRKTKRRAYARAGIPTYWIVNLIERQVEVYTRPSGATAEPVYADQRNYSVGEGVPVVIDGREAGRVDVTTILP